MNKHTQNLSQNDLFPKFFSLSAVNSKKVEVGFTAPDLSSQDCLTLLREFDQRIGFIGRLTCCLEDKWVPQLIRHSYEEMLSQRIFQIAAGYEDGDDCDLLRNDSLLKICTGRTPDAPALGSRPAISGLENGRSIRELYDMGVCFVEEFTASCGDEPECIILDVTTAT